LRKLPSIGASPAVKAFLGRPRVGVGIGVRPGISIGEGLQEFDNLVFFLIGQLEVADVKFCPRMRAGAPIELYANPGVTLLKITRMPGRAR
jgi:hypothetical protein